MENPFLRVASISKSFGAIVALRDVYLEMGSDELVVVLGPTGAGKTTLLRTLAGLEIPDSGHIQMDGHDITHLPPSERDVALVFQNFSLYPSWTVRENLTFPLRAPGRELSDVEIGKQVDWAADILKITPLLDRPSTRLSGGEMQRVAIGRAIVRRPKLFLMDEPLTNLDAKLRESLRVELIRLRRELNIPMLYVTHDQVEALSMADRIVVLSEGEILQTGSSQLIYENPVTPEVAKQLGSPGINLIEVTNREGKWLSANGMVVLPSSADQQETMTLGVRPEDISPNGGASPGTIRVVENMGPSKILLVDWAGQQIHIMISSTEVYSPGDTIHPKIEAERINLWPSIQSPEKDPTRWRSHRLHFTQNFKLVQSTREFLADLWSIWADAFTKAIPEEVMVRHLKSMGFEFKSGRAEKSVKLVEGRA